ncbi:MAG: ADP-ribosylglycohydrolase family protein [Phycisphaerae bacterium]|nr:ADP-ribosylglycohydrolase family protein [Phycisphaerae bacterium]
MKNATRSILVAGVSGLFLLVGVAVVPASAAPEAGVRRLSVREYRDRMKAGWIGQIAGVAWGAPTEFKWKDAIIPEESVPKWTPDMINNAFEQDDIYVEMTFLRTLEQYGLDAPIRQAGIDFANSRYPLWCANLAGRRNLREGIAPPDSGHPQFNKCPNDIDYQIEADYSGLIAPGLPNTAIALGEKFGRLMNYGDGIYGGQFVGGMYAEAFFETDRFKVIDAGLKCIPAGSQYAEMVRDMLTWYRQNPTDWQKTWQLAQKKYREDPEYQKASNGGIDVKINGAYILMGMLYGEGDPDKTIVISMRSGQDSDCNPSNAAGVLFATMGFSQLPERFTKELNHEKEFLYTAYNVPRLMDVCEKLARQAVVKAGGRIEKDAAGEEVFVIPVEAPKPSALELSWAPGPIANSRFTEQEMAKITQLSPSRAFVKFAPGWTLRDCGQQMDIGLHEEARGRKNVYMTHPPERDQPCILSRKLEVPAGKKTALHLVVGHHPKGDWLLIVKANGRELLKKPVGKQTASDGWLSVDVDLSSLAGQTVELELLNQPTDWTFECGYWAEIAIVSE